MTTDEILTAPDSPLAPPPHARIVHLAVRVRWSINKMLYHTNIYTSNPLNYYLRICCFQVLRAEGNTTYGDCILPSFQQLFQAAAVSLHVGEMGACITR